jgi:hypothetical protein
MTLTLYSRFWQFLQYLIAYEISGVFFEFRFFQAQPGSHFFDSKGPCSIQDDGSDVVREQLIFLFWYNLARVRLKNREEMCSKCFGLIFFNCGSRPVS